MAKVTETIQVVENSDRFHVSRNRVPVYTFLFSVDGRLGVSREFALMNANSEAYLMAVDFQFKHKDNVVLLPMVKK